MQIQKKFHEKAQEYGDKLKNVAFGLFFLCILVDVAFLGAKAALNRSELSETIKEFSLMIVFASFCYCAIVYYQEWTHYILDKAFSISSSIGGANTLMLSPIDLGFRIASDILDLVKEVSWNLSGLGNVICYFFMAFVVLLCYSLITARLLLILCESYVAINIAILLLGFGGSSMTKDYALNTMRYVLSVGFKFLTMLLIMGVGLSFVEDFQIIENMGFEDLFVIIASSVILLALVMSLPETVAGIITGSHMGGGVGMKAAAAMIGAATGAVAGFAAGTVAKAGHSAQVLSAAHKIASLEGHQAGGGGAATGEGGSGGVGDGGETGAQSRESGMGGFGGSSGTVGEGIGGGTGGETTGSEEGVMAGGNEAESGEGTSENKKSSAGGSTGIAGAVGGSKVGSAVRHMGRMGRAIYNANKTARHSMNMHSTQMKRTKAAIQETVNVNKGYVDDAKKMSKKTNEAEYKGHDNE